MNQALITHLFRSFEQLAHREGGLEYWLARELPELLGYTQWRNFEQVIAKAKEACRNAGQEVSDHFADVSKMVDVGSGARREVEDVALTRYAAYLLAQNGDPRKEEIAFAQTYFAVQTRKQELIEARLEEVERLEARKRLVASEKELSGVIFERLREHESFARIRSKGDAALFGGWTTRDMKDRFGVSDSRPLADFLPAITKDHVANNRELRDALSRRGIKPEALPPAEDIKKVERRLKSEETKLSRGVPRPKKDGQTGSPRGSSRARRPNGQ